MRTRIVVADRTEARIYDAAGVDTGLHLVDELFDPQGRLHLPALLLEQACAALNP